jgi:uncharacterized repeat protein (TIGR03803 family)
MKTCIKKSFVLPVLVAGLGLVVAGEVTAQTLTILHSFGDLSSYPINSDGTNPSGLLLSGDTLYGTTWAGGSWGYGTVFKINTNGAGFTTIYEFDGSSGTGSPLHSPFLDLLSGNTLYGHTEFGGSSNDVGALFALNTDGTGFITLREFTGGSDGAEPAVDVVSADILYGTAREAGWGGGTVFALKTDGSVFTVLHRFTPLGGFNTWSDGSGPGGLILSGDTLYGTASGGGSWNQGTVFSLKTDGTGFTNLYEFSQATFSNSFLVTNEDGASPNALILSGDTLYGDAWTGGPSGSGTVFRVNTNGTGFKVLHSFTGGSGGAQPGGLILSGGMLYGTAVGFYNTDPGMAFQISTNGTGFGSLHSFTATDTNSLGFYTNSDGLVPSLSSLSANILYGASFEGGLSGSGNLFGLSLPLTLPLQLTITPVGANVILSWPTNSTGFTLQSTTSLVPPVIWTTNLPAPIVVNGHNTLTYSVTATQQFFGLSQ